MLELDALNNKLGNNWKPIATVTKETAIDLFADAPKNELAKVIEIWQDAFEFSYYDTVMAGILLSGGEDENENKKALLPFFV